MKCWHKLFVYLAFFELYALPLSAQQFCHCPKPYQEENPRHLTFSADNIWKSKFKKDGFRDKEIGYRIERMKIDSILYYDPICEEGIRVGASYSHTRLKWESNPFFDRKNFNTLSLSLSGLSNRLGDWLWIGDITAHVDTDNFNLSRYLTWDLTLWGEYTVCQDMHLHFGFYALTGMKVDRVYPILGLDWKGYRNFELNLVYPCNLSANWKFDPYWSTGPAVRFFEARHRVSKREPVPCAIWEYRNWGFEWALNYGYSHVCANVHAGYTIGGRTKVSNRHHDNSHLFRFKAAPYLGGELTLAF